MAILTHLGKGIAPSAALTVREIARSGQQDRVERIVGEGMGVRPRLLDVAEVAGKAAWNIKADNDESTRIISRLKSGRYMSKDGFLFLEPGIEDVVTRHQYNMNEVQRRMHNLIHAALNFGVPSDELNRLLSGRNSGVGFSRDRIRDAYNGVMPALRPDRAFIASMTANLQRTNEQDPAERLAIMREIYAKKPEFYNVGGGVPPAK
jgi:hypothetical protein